MAARRELWRHSSPSWRCRGATATGVGRPADERRARHQMGENRSGLGQSATARVGRGRWACPAEDRLESRSHEAPGPSPNGRVSVGWRTVSDAVRGMGREATQVGDLPHDGGPIQ